jgi:hypothetical protein
MKCYILYICNFKVKLNKYSKTYYKCLLDRFMSVEAHNKDLCHLYGILTYS